MSKRPYRRIFRFVSNRADSEEVDQEFQFHLAMRARELEAQGHTPEQARELALAQFGDIEDARRSCRADDEERMREHRRTLWLDHVRQDFQQAVRALRRHPSFAFSTVVTLAIAIALAASAYGIMHAYLVRPLPYPNSGELVRLRQSPTREFFPNAPSFEQVDWSSIDSIFASTVSWNPDGFMVASGSRTEPVQGAWVSPKYFTELGLRPALGRAFARNEHDGNAAVVIISDALWSRLFARDPSLVGKAIRVQSLESPEDAELATVVGIMPPDAWHVDSFTDLLRPLPATPRFPMIARLKPGMSIAEAEQRLNAIVLPTLGKIDPAFRMSIGGLQEEYTHRLRPTLMALVGGALFLLLIAGASVAGAQAARGAARLAEIQVRLALGASRGRILLQLVVESLAIALAAGIIGAVIASIVLTSFGTIVGRQLGAAVPGGGGQLAPQAGMLALVVVVGAAIGIAFGLLPAIVVTRSAVASSKLHGAAQKGITRSLATPLLRRGLIIAQVAFTMMLLVGAGLMGRTIIAIAVTPLGFNVDEVLKGDLFMPPARYSSPQALRATVDKLLAGTAALPGVTQAAASFPDPLRTFTMPPVPVKAEGSNAADTGRRSAQYIVTANFFKALDIPVKIGRSFDARDASTATPVAIISEGLATALWPGESGLGRRVQAEGDSVWRTVVGVVGETRQPVEAIATDELYLPYEQNPIEMIWLLARVNGDPIQLGGALQSAVARVDNGLGLANVGTLRDLADRPTRRHHAMASVLSLFALLALGLAMLGLYAALAYAVAQRRREIAVRVAVGADSWSVRGLIAREGGALVGAGLIIGTALSLSLTRLIASQLYGVTPTDPVTFAAMVILLGAAALSAALIPMRQATRIAPAEMLRSD